MINVDIVFPDGQQLSLSSSPPTNGSYCPGTVQFTCRGTKIPVSLEWKINENFVAIYNFRLTHMFPFAVRLDIPSTSSSLEDVEVTILTAVSDGFSLNITSVLKGNVDSLQGSTVYCTPPAILLSSEKYHVDIQGKLLH